MDAIRIAGSNKFFVFLFGLFVVRGIALQCLSPPLEGPDEYQHIAVIHYLVENRSLPVYGEAKVPVSLYDDIVANPHPEHSRDQTWRIGGRSYATFYSKEPGRTHGTPINLYQAQHPPLYYIAMAPLYSLLRSVADFRTTVYLLRVFNIIAGGSALVLLMLPARRLFSDESLYRIVCLAVIASPMFMTYVSRVANDAFALVFAGAGLAVAAGLVQSKHGRLSALIIGLCAGAAVLCKLNALVMLPAVFLYLVIMAALSTMRWSQCALYCVIIAIGYVLVSFPYHVFSYGMYGSLIFNQATWHSQQAGIGLLDVLVEARFSHMYDFLAKSICIDNLWTSGWSFLQPPRMFKRAYGMLLLIAATGIPPWLRSRSRVVNVGLINDWRGFVLSALLVVVTLCALYYFALKHAATYNFLTTPSYYFMIAYPAFIACVVCFALGWGRRFATMVVLSLIAVFIFTELCSVVFVAVPHWTSSHEWNVIVSRLSGLHPVFPAPVYFPFLYALYVLFCIIGLCVLLGRHRSC